MTTYQVTWEIDVEADSPEQAAHFAKEAQAPGTAATVFHVAELDETNGSTSDGEDIDVGGCCGE